GAVEWPPSPRQCSACALFSYVRSAILTDERSLHFQLRRDKTQRGSTLPWSRVIVQMCLVETIHGTSSGTTHARPNVPITVIKMSRGLIASVVTQNRPTVVRAKPANGRGRGLSCSTLQPPVEASLFSYANS